MDTRISKINLPSVWVCVCVFKAELVEAIFTSVGEQDISIRVLQMICNEHIKVRKCHPSPWGRQQTHRAPNWCSTASRSLNTTGTGSNPDRASSSSLRRLPTLWRRLRSSRGFSTPSSKVSEHGSRCSSLYYRCVCVFASLQVFQSATWLTASLCST